MYIGYLISFSIFRYTTRHLNDESTPKHIKSLLAWRNMISEKLAFFSAFFSYKKLVKMWCVIICDMRRNKSRELCSTLQYMDAIFCFYIHLKTKNITIYLWPFCILWNREYWFFIDSLDYLEFYDVFSFEK